MDPLIILVAAVAIAVVIGLLVRKAGGAEDPENPVGPDARRESRTGTEDPSDTDIPAYPAGSRPGGPGAESMNPTQAGDPVPGDDGVPSSDDEIKPSDARHKPLD